MRVEWWWKVGAVLLTWVSPAGTRGVAEPPKAPRSGQCLRAVIEGEVRAGESFARNFGGGLELRLEAIAGGWVVRVLPSPGDRPQEDYAGIATPPYRSVSPLLVSTDFRFRAQDAVGWNPRRFRYARDARAFGELEAVYRRVAGTATPAAAEEARLAELVTSQPEGVLEILDASLAPGTADQTRAAGLVSSHYGTAAHRIEQPAGGRATALGCIGWMQFRVKLELGRGVRVPAGVLEERFPCGGR